MDKIIDEQYLKDNQNHVLVFGDNLLRKGKGGAAVLRDFPNTYGFITKKFPRNDSDCFYTPDEYLPVYKEEIEKLKIEIQNHPEKTYLISRLGGGLANRYYIFEQIVNPNIKNDLNLTNIEFLW